MTRIVIADDHPIILSGVEALLRGTPFEIVASFADGASLLGRLPELDADIVLLDIEMPRCSGLEVLRTLRADNNTIPVVLFTAAIDQRDADEALGLGASGMVLKDSAPGSLIRCLEEVSQGRRWIDQPILQRALDSSDETSGAVVGPLSALSQRERQVMEGVIQGQRNRDIAASLGITEGTVKVHLHKVYVKLGVSSRTELMIVTNAIG